jgi:hypothetical protein
MAVERTVKCPSCTRETRLTEDELTTKRGFCAACDARFELTPEMFVGAPFRAIEVIGAKQVAPPTHLITVQETPEATTFRVRPEVGFQSVFMMIWSVLAIGMGIMVIGTAHFFNPVAVIFPLVGLTLGCFALYRVAGEERIAIAGGKLRRERRLLGRTLPSLGQMVESTQEVALDEIQSFRIARSNFGKGQTNAHIKVGTTGRPLKIGTFLGHDEEALEWLIRSFERSLRERRIAARRAAQPQLGDGRDSLKA